jgi:hypothetical protein
MEPEGLLPYSKEPTWSTSSYPIPLNFIVILFSSLCLGSEFFQLKFCMHFSCPITNKVVEENKIKQILHNDQYKTDNKDLKSKKTK